MRSYQGMYMGQGTNARQKVFDNPLLEGVRRSKIVDWYAGLLRAVGQDIAMKS